MAGPRPVPLHRIAATTDGALLIGAIGRHLQVYDLASGDVLASTIPRSDSAQAHKATIRLVVVHETPERKVVITVGEDKLLKVWELPTLELRSSRELVKRANSLTVAPDGKRIVVADKSGDVYDLPLDADQDPALSGLSASKGKQAAFQAGTLIAGHVSLLTSVLVLSHPSSPCPLLVTGDRDEHVRISAFPNAFIIHRFLLGHRSFVAALAWCPGVGDGGGVLISGGGDPSLRLWDVVTGRELGRINVAPLGDTCVVDAHPPRKLFRKPKTSQADGDVEDSRSTSSNRPSKRQICVNRILVSPLTSSGHRNIVIVSAGCTAFGIVSSSSLLHSPLSPPCPKVHDCGAPILDAFLVASDRLLVSVDISRAASDVAPEPLQCYHISVDGDVTNTCTETTALSSIARSHTSNAPSLERSPTLVLPSKAELYPDLTFLLKEGQSPDGEDETGDGIPNGKRRKKEVRPEDAPTARTERDERVYWERRKKAEGRAKSGQMVAELLSASAQASRPGVADGNASEQA